MPNLFPVNGAPVNGAGDTGLIEVTLLAPNTAERYPGTVDPASGSTLIVNLPKRMHANVGEGLLLNDIDLQVVAQTGEVAAQLQLIVEEVFTVIGTGTAEADIELDVTGVGTVEADIKHVVFNSSYYFDFATFHGFCWEAIVTLGSDAGDRPGESGDISTNLTGDIGVEAEENAARIANFTREPRPYGPCPTETDPEFLDLQRHVGRSVTIDYVLRDSDLVILSTTRIFTGSVDEVDYDPVSRLTSYTCTDGRQLLLENMDRATVDSLTPTALYSPFIFDPDSDNFVYAEDRLSTTPYALDLDSNGNWLYTPFKAGLSSSLFWDESNVLYETLGIQIEKYRDITTEVHIEGAYSFLRLRERSANFSWSYPGGTFYTGGFCNYLESGHTLPKKDMVVSAANGGSWRLTDVTFENMPPSSWISCGLWGGRAWVNSGNGFAPLFTMDVSGTIAKRFTNSIRENYILRILAPASTTQFGSVVEELSFDVRAEFDPLDWTSEGAAIEEAVIDRDPYVVYTVQSVDTSDFGYPFTTNGTDRYFDAVTDETVVDGEGNRVDLDLALRTIIAQGKTIILQAHRQNSVSWSTPLIPLIELNQTYEVETCPVHARGKVRSFTHRMDMLSGDATTEITLAISKVAGVPVSEDPTVAPDAPDTVTGMGNGSPSLSLGTRYGGQGGSTLFKYDYGTVPSPVIDSSEPYPGYSGNRSPQDVGSNLYPIQFQIETEAIDEVDREPVEEDQNQDYDVDIPDDLLNLQA